MSDAFGLPSRVLVLGGGSEIGQAIVAALLAETSADVVLAGRRPDALPDALLGARSVSRVAFDATATEAHPAFFDQVFAGGDVDLVVVAFGVLGEQAEAESDPAAAVHVATTNYVGAVSALTHAYQRLVGQGRGTVVVLSSVAGQKARRSNFVYGSSKAGLDAFTEGLQLSSEGTGVSVVLVRPGFVKTRMTAHLKPAPFATTPDAVAAAVVASLGKGNVSVWVPAILRPVMWLIRALPPRVLRSL